MSDTTQVVFRMDDGEVVAVFPTMLERDGMIGCYARLGQHSMCSREWVRNTRPARPDEYASLRAELERIGYKLDIRTRIGGGF